MPSVSVTFSAFLLRNVLNLVTRMTGDRVKTVSRFFGRELPLRTNIDGCCMVDVDWGEDKKAAVAGLKLQNLVRRGFHACHMSCPRQPTDWTLRRILYGRCMATGQLRCSLSREYQVWRGEDEQRLDRYELACKGHMVDAKAGTQGPDLVT